MSDELETLRAEVARLTKLAQAISDDCNRTANERNDLRAQLAASFEALDSFVRISEEAFLHWDNDRDSKVGKMLMAMARYTKGYDARIDAIHEHICSIKPPGEQQ